MKPFCHHFRVPFHELDPGGVLFHAHVFVHAHLAYEALMRELGWGLATLLQEGRLVIPLVEARAKYLRPLHLDDRVEIRIVAAEIGKKHFTLEYRFLREGEPCVQVETTHVTVERKNGKAVPLPPGLAAALESYRPEES